MPSESAAVQSPHPSPLAGGAVIPLSGGRVAVEEPGQRLRTLASAGLWMGVFPWAMHALGKLRSPAVQRAWAGGLLHALDVRLEMEGADHAEPGQRYVVVALHESFADALALLRLPLPLRFALRDELLGWRLLGPLLQRSGHIAVRPEAGARAYRRLFRGAHAAVRGGHSVAVFAQGTILGIETELREGAFRLARALELPVLPVALTGGHRVWEHPFSPLLRYGQRISVRVLPAVPAAEVRRCPSDIVRRRVQRDLKAAALDGRMAAPRRFAPERDGFWDGYAFEIDPAFPELRARIRARREHTGRDVGARPDCGLTERRPTTQDRQIP